MKLKTIINSRNFFDKLRYYSFSPVSKNLDVVRYIGRVNEYLSFYESEINKIINKYGSVNEDQIVTFNDDAKIDAEKLIEELFNVSVSDLPKFPLSDDNFKDCLEPTQESQKLTVNDLLFLDELRRETLSKNCGK